jgi:hypothetical protein
MFNSHSAAGLWSRIQSRQIFTILAEAGAVLMFWLRLQVRGEISYLKFSYPEGNI